MQTKASASDKHKLFRLNQLIPALETDIINGLVLLLQSYSELKVMAHKYNDSTLKITTDRAVKDVTLITKALSDLKTLKFDNDIFGDLSNFDSEKISINNAIKNRRKII